MKPGKRTLVSTSFRDIAEIFKECFDKSSTNSWETMRKNLYEDFVGTDIPPSILEGINKRAWIMGNLCAEENKRNEKINLARLQISISPTGKKNIVMEIVKLENLKSPLFIGSSKVTPFVTWKKKLFILQIEIYLEEDDSRYVRTLIVPNEGFSEVGPVSKCECKSIVTCNHLNDKLRRVLK